MLAAAADCAVEAPRNRGGGGVAPELPGVFAWLVPILDSYGYLAVFGVLFIESFGAPVPGQTMLMAAGEFAGAGRVNGFVIAVLGFTAAGPCNNVCYLIRPFRRRQQV